MDISKIRLNDTNYDIKDNVAREQIQDIINKKFLLIGDSYGQGYIHDGNVTGWTTLLKSKLENLGFSVETASMGGASFGSATLFNTILQSLNDDSEITDIIIAGGYNDITINENAILNGMQIVKNTCRAKFPNATLYIANIAGCYNEQHSNLMLLHQKYSNSANTLNIAYMNNTCLCLNGKEYFTSDYIHPNQNGQNLISNVLFQAIFSNYNLAYFGEITFTPDNAFNNTSSTFHVYNENDITTLNNYAGTIFLNYTENTQIETPSSIKIGSISGKGFYGNKYGFATISIGNVIIHDANNGYYSLPAVLQFNDGDVFLNLHDVNDEHSSYRTFANVVQLQIPIFSITLPTLCC